MPRWEHGSAERLRQAAMELFEEQGFEETSAVQIAARARVTTRTFFRYFPDKEEILFADAGELQESLAGELLRTADVTEPLAAVTRTLAGFGWEQLGSREAQRRRTAMIASNPALLERDLLKQHRLVEALRDALLQRGVGPGTAGLAAGAGSQIFRTAYRQWLESDDDTGLPERTTAATALLATLLPSGAADQNRRRSIT